MPLANRKTSKPRADFARSLNDSEIDSLISDPELQVLQTHSEVEGETWDLLNRKLLVARPDIELRVYLFAAKVCDLSFLPRIANVRHFTADSLRQATGLEHLASLSQLESLSIGIYDLTSFDFLADLQSDRLRKLSLQATKSKKPCLNVIQRFSHLRTLYLERQQKGIEVLSDLHRLEELGLRSISTSDIRYVRDLDRLWSIDIKLGGTADLSALADMNHVKYLELWQIRGLKDISFISQMRGLQYLFLQSLPNVREMPDVSQLTSLRKIYLDSMSGVTDLSPLSAAPALEEFIHVSALGMKPEDYIPLQKVKSLKHASVGFGSEKKNAALRELMSQMGVDTYTRHPFEFR
ncbi:MAG TPA: hypothetical protein VHU84_03285 [Lacipirellulaceae bacterium]|nr:hypothetical protein [Lacipirellulaceae bacterium]